MPLVIQSDRGYSERLDGLCLTSYYVEFGLPCSLLGLILTLVATFSNQCSCCGTCCCLCCSEPFEFGALVTSSPYIPYILGPDGQLVREGEADKGEDKGEAAETLEMEESKDGGEDELPPGWEELATLQGEVAGSFYNQSLYCLSF